MVPVTGHIRSENYSSTQRPDVGHVQMVRRSYGGKPVLIFWITMNRPGPLCGRPSTCIRALRCRSSGTAESRSRWRFTPKVTGQVARAGAPGNERSFTDRIGLSATLTTRTEIEPSSSACQCPSHDRRVKGAYGVAGDRFATLDPVTAHQGFGAYEEEGVGAGGAGCCGGGDLRDQGMNESADLIADQEAASDHRPGHDL
jgi:hypothetical protein